MLIMDGEEMNCPLQVLVKIIQHHPVGVMQTSWWSWQCVRVDGKTKRYPANVVESDAQLITAATLPPRQSPADTLSTLRDAAEPCERAGRSLPTCRRRKLLVRTRRRRRRAHMSGHQSRALEIRRRRRRCCCC